MVNRKSLIHISKYFLYFKPQLAIFVETWPWLNYRGHLFFEIWGCWYHVFSALVGVDMSESCGVSAKKHSWWAFLKDEIVCHFPYAVFSIACAIIALSFVSYDVGSMNPKGAHRLFHSFHFLHLIFSATGAVLMFRRHSKNVILAILVGLLVPASFCTLSDAFLPYLGGRFVGLNMHFHWCFLSHLDTVLPFLAIGVIQGWMLSSHSKSKHVFYSTTTHFLHILVSSMASLMYLVSFGFSNWWNSIGFIFIFLLFAVVVPCSLSDVVVPFLCARLGKKSSATLEKCAFCSSGSVDEKNKV